MNKRSHKFIWFKITLGFNCLCKLLKNNEEQVHKNGAHFRA